MRSRTSSLNGECQIRKLLILSILHKPQINLFKLSLSVNHVASCEERGSGHQFIRCINEASDEYATLKFYTTEYCGFCDTSCPPNHLVATTTFGEKSTTGIPPQFQRLRDLMNNTCLDRDSGIPDSLRRKVGPNTIDGDSLQDAVMAELENLFPDLRDFGIDCRDVAEAGTCDCGGLVAGKYTGIN